MGRWDFFFRAESNRRDPKSVPAHYISLVLPDDLPLAEALEAARKAGMPKGSHRTGCFEVQSPLGIYSHVANARIDLSTPRKAAKVRFLSWDAEEETL